MVARLWRRAGTRRAERGAAVFVVVMVITLLTAVGVFAARSASLVDMASGYDRQLAQTQYISEYGALSAVTELGSGSAKAYIDQLQSGTDDCRGAPPITVDGLPVHLPCHKIFMSEIAARVNQSSRTNLLEAADTDKPGSLGPFGLSTQAALSGDFVIEITDPGPLEKPMPGTAEAGAPKFLNYLQVALTSYGQVRQAQAGAACTQASATTAGLQGTRVHAVVGPY